MTKTLVVTEEHQVRYPSESVPGVWIIAWWCFDGSAAIAVAPSAIEAAAQMLDVGDVIHLITSQADGLHKFSIERAGRVPKLLCVAPFRLTGRPFDDWTETVSRSF